MNPVTIYPLKKSIRGDIVKLVGDKSVSFRALLFPILFSDGYINIAHLNNGEDIKKTIIALKNLGVKIEQSEERIRVYAARGKLLPYDSVIEVGGSATAARILMGILSAQDFESELHGNMTLNKRSMLQIVKELEKIGANILLSEHNTLPALIKPGVIRNRDSKIKAPSAQIQTALICASLMSEGYSSVEYSRFLRDHTEKMLQSFGFEFSLKHEGQFSKIEFYGKQNIVQRLNYQIFNDPSMAAYFIVAAILVPGSDLTLRDVYVQKNRTGYIEILQQMGAKIEFSNLRIVHNEEIADIRVKHSILNGVDIPAEIAPAMIDEYPIIAVAASFAQGTTIMRGVGELKNKESNRILSIAQALGKLGVHFDIAEDYMAIIGANQKFEGGVLINSFGDHRIVMSFAIFALMTEKPIIISDISSINATFPNFFDILSSLSENALILN